LTGGGKQAIWKKEKRNYLLIWNNALAAFQGEGLGKGDIRVVNGEKEESQKGSGVKNCERLSTHVFWRWGKKPLAFLKLENSARKQEGRTNGRSAHAKLRENWHSYWGKLTIPSRVGGSGVFEKILVPEKGETKLWMKNKLAGNLKYTETRLAVPFCKRPGVGRLAR